LDQVPLAPQVCIALSNYSKKFVNQTSLSAETLVKNDLSEMLAREWDRVALNGSGTNQPLGILQNTTIQTNSAGIQGGTNGAALTWAQILAMESQVATYNADEGSLAYLTNPIQRGRLKAVTESSSGFPPFIWQTGAAPGEGSVNGYRALTTTLMPANLTKGTATANCSAVIYGDWSSLVVGSWDDAIDFLVNPYTNQASAGVTVSMEISITAVVKHPESFAIITDAL
jgi:HK97 family phage major capsid protein